MDLVFAVDGSDRVAASGEDSFRRMLNFVNILANDVSAFGEQSRAALITIGNHAKLVFNFDEVLDQISLAKALESVRFPGNLCA